MNNNIKQEKADLEKQTLDSAKLLFFKNGNNKFYCKQLANYLKVHPRTVKNRLRGNVEIHKYMLNPSEARSKARLEPRKSNLVPTLKQIRSKPKKERRVTEEQINRLSRFATCPKSFQRCKALRG